jgi:hypothetical protein
LGPSAPWVRALLLLGGSRSTLTGAVVSVTETSAMPCKAGIFASGRSTVAAGVYGNPFIDLSTGQRLRIVTAPHGTQPPFLHAYVRCGARISRLRRFGCGDASGSPRSRPDRNDQSGRAPRAEERRARPLIHEATPHQGPPPAILARTAGSQSLAARLSRPLRPSRRRRVTAAAGGGLVSNGTAAENLMQPCVNWTPWPMGSRGGPAAARCRGSLPRPFEHLSDADLLLA